jgi:hypothetical protein
MECLWVKPYHLICSPHSITCFESVSREHLVVDALFPVVHTIYGIFKVLTAAY